MLSIVQWTVIIRIAPGDEKDCGVTRVTRVMWSASLTNRRDSWHPSHHKHKPELDIIIIFFF